MQNFGSKVLVGVGVAGLGFALCFLLVVPPCAPVEVNKQWHRVDKYLYQSYATVGFICSL